MAPSWGWARKWGGAEATVWRWSGRRVGLKDGEGRPGRTGLLEGSPTCCRRARLQEMACRGGRRSIYLSVDRWGRCGTRPRDGHDRRVLCPIVTRIQLDIQDGCAISADALDDPARSDPGIVEINCNQLACGATSEPFLLQFRAGWAVGVKAVVPLAPVRIFRGESFPAGTTRVPCAVSSWKKPHPAEELSATTVPCGKLKPVAYWNVFMGTWSQRIEIPRSTHRPAAPSTREVPLISPKTARPTATTEKTRTTTAIAAATTTDRRPPRGLGSMFNDASTDWPSSRPGSHAGHREHLLNAVPRCC